MTKTNAEKKIISEGYTLEVVSWENDGDNYKTEFFTVKSKELAIAVAKMCKELFVSCNNKGKGIGNMMEDEGDEAREIILPYMKTHPELYSDKKNLSDDKLVDICMEYNHKLLGGSEYYYSRVLESCIITYSPKDIFLEEIKF